MAHKSHKISGVFNLITKDVNHT